MTDVVPLDDPDPSRELVLPAGLPELDQRETEFRELRIYARRTKGAWEVISTLAEQMKLQVNLGLEEFTNPVTVRRFLAFLEVCRDLLAPPDEDSWL